MDLRYKEQLVLHLLGGEAFLPLEKILGKISPEQLGEKPQDLPYSFYEIFYHIRFTQKDIIGYCTSKNYISPQWPDDYWPNDSNISQEEWEKLKLNYFRERDQLIEFIRNSNTNLVNPVREGVEHTVLREILLVIEHTAYHTGQMLIVLRNLGLYKNN